MAILDLTARACMGGESGASAWAVLQHVPYETPGLIETVARARGLEIDCRHLYRGNAVPNLDELVGLVVLGGPMGVRDVEEYPHLHAEIDLIAAALAADRPVLGVCLGAQLFAQALGADVLRGSMTEVGLGSVALTPAGEGDPVLGPAGRWLPVLHWHQDTFTVPAGADLLASSRRYENQAFRVAVPTGSNFMSSWTRRWWKTCRSICRTG